MMKKGFYLFTNVHIRGMIRDKMRSWWWGFSLVLIPLGMTLYGPIATFIDRLDGVSAAAGNSYWHDFTNDHMLSFCFGIAFLVFFAVGFFSIDSHELVRMSSLITGGKEIQPEEVDANANAPDSDWLPNLGVILSPKFIIGHTTGVTVVRYEDIQMLKTVIVNKRVHISLGKWEEMDALQLKPSGNVSEFLIAESTADPELVQMELDIIREKCQQFHPEQEIKIQKTKRTAIQQTTQKTIQKKTNKRSNKKTNKRTNKRTIKKTNKKK